MFHLDYISCILTILTTVLVARKSWVGLLSAIVNSLIVCVIGFRTSQFGFIPANLICICVNAFTIRSWVEKANTHRIRRHPAAEVGATATTTLNAPCTSIVHHNDTMRIQRGRLAGFNHSLSWALVRSRGD